MHPPFGGTVRSRRLLLVLAAMAVVVAACGAASDPSPLPGASGPSGTLPTVSVEPAGTPRSSGGPEPGVPSPDTASTPGPDATPAPTEDGAGPGAGSAARCSGSPENRDFYLAVAEAVDWTVLCPVLPDGWFVESGTYRLAGGGWLEIAYRGPDGAGIRLREGAFCPDASGCVPGGAELGELAVGPLAGRLIATDDGGWAAVVDRGAQRSWLLEGSGLAEDVFRSLAAGLEVVDA